MNKTLAILIGLALIPLSFGFFTRDTEPQNLSGGTGTIGQLEQFKRSGNYITQNVASTSIKLTGYESSGYCLVTNASGVVSTSTCGAGSGDSNWLSNGSRLTPSTTVGIGVFASSTIGNGTGAGGLTVSGGATTTGNAYFGGGVALQGWALSTSTVVCMAPEQCQFQATASTSHTVVQNAANYIRSIGGGKIIFKPGVYTFTNTVIVYNNTELTAETGVTIKRPAATGISALFHNETYAGSTTANSNIKIHGFVFDGGGDVNSYNEFRHAIGLYGVNDSAIYNNRFINMSGDGIYVSSTNTTYSPSFVRSYNIRIFNNHFDGTNQNRNGVSIIDAEEVTIYGNTFDRMASSSMPGAIDLEPNDLSQVIRAVSITGNTFKGSNRGVNFANVFSSNAVEVTISGNTFSDSLLYDIQGSTWRVVDIVGNTFSSSTLESIQIVGSPDINIVGNSFFFGRASAINIIFSSGGVNITGNSIINIAKHAIWLDSVQTGNISGNLVRNWGVTPSTVSSYSAVYGQNGTTNLNIVGNTFNDAINGSHVAIQSVDTSSNWSVANNFVFASTTAVLAGTGNSIITQTNGNIGIGTTTPSALLSLGNISSSSAPGTTSAQGINFGDSLANLYRSAAGTLRTDSAFISGAITANSTVIGPRFTPNSATLGAGANGMYLPAANTLGFGTNGSLAMVINNTSNIGIGTTTPSNKLTIAGELGFFGTIPTLSSCGTSPSITKGSTDSAGKITQGTISTGCTITFSSAKTNAPFCYVEADSGLTFSKTVSASAITITNIGALSGTDMIYHCIANNN